MHEMQSSCINHEKLFIDNVQFLLPSRASNEKCRDLNSSLEIQVQRNSTNLKDGDKASSINSKKRNENNKKTVYRSDDRACNVLSCVYNNYELLC